MRKRASHGTTIAALVCLPVLLLASARQEPAVQATPPRVFSTGSEVVMVLVSVRDH